MKEILRAPYLGILLLVSLIPIGCAEPRRGPLVAFEVGSRENTLDGCTACGCVVRGELEPGAGQEWWVSFGLVRPDDSGDWKVAGSSSHCGSGSFDRVAPAFTSTVGTPYVIVDLSSNATLLPAGEVELDTELRFRKLSGFDANGTPAYESSARKRQFSFTGAGNITLPLLVADQRETTAFAVHEVLLRMRAEALGLKPAASYGTVSVSADLPGAQILLDGGPVGRVAEGKGTVLRNVLAGTREIRVVGFSGRDAVSQVTVKEGGTSEVSLDILGLNPSGAGSDLVPIGSNPQGFEEYWRVRDGAMVVTIPAGDFLMGSREGEGQPDERPQHRVHVSEFLMDKTEVTWRQLRKFAAATGAPLPRTPVYGAPDDYPASFVSWEESLKYCEWVGGRLPTEAEWEKAARGTDGRIYSWGNAWDPRRCNSISGGMHRPESAGSLAGCVSPYGVLDMPGSMWEWCADRYGGTYYSESPARDPTGPTTGTLRVIRGGAWMSQPTWLRAAYRAKAAPVSGNVDHGFRCAQDAPE